MSYQRDKHLTHLISKEKVKIEFGMDLDKLDIETTKKVIFSLGVLLECELSVKDRSSHLYDLQRHTDIIYAIAGEEIELARLEYNARKIPEFEKKIIPNSGNFIPEIVGGFDQ